MDKADAEVHAKTTNEVKVPLFGNNCSALRQLTIAFQVHVRKVRTVIL